MRFLLTGAGGQLARGLLPCLAGDEAVALTREQLDITVAATARVAVERYGRRGPERRREVIELVRRSPLPKRHTLAELGLACSTY